MVSGHKPCQIDPVVRAQSPTLDDGRAVSTRYFAGWPTPMSSKYSMPAAPAFGLVLSPTPTVIFLIAVTTEMLVRSIKFHQPLPMPNLHMDPAANTSDTTPLS